MAITQNDLEILKSEIMADTPDGGGLPTGIAVVDGVSNNLFPDVSDIDALEGRVRFRKVFPSVNTANNDLLQASRLVVTEVPSNPNMSIFMIAGTRFADERTDIEEEVYKYATPQEGYEILYQGKNYKGLRVLQFLIKQTDGQFVSNGDVIKITQLMQPVPDGEVQSPPIGTVLYDQFVKVLSVSYTEVQIDITSYYVASMTIKEKLDYDFGGAANSVQPATVFATRQDPDLKFYGATKLGLAANFGAEQVTLSSSKLRIAPSGVSLDSKKVGVNLTRLPDDGLVDLVDIGDLVTITELKLMELPTNAPNDTFDLGFERLSDISVVDVNGAKVNSDYLDIDLDAGTLTLNGMFDMSFYTSPLTVRYRIMDLAKVESVNSNVVSLLNPITHDYTDAAVFSTMLLMGDMQARDYNIFSQKSWGNGVWSDTLIGDATTSQLQVTNNPIVVTNRDAIEERWALVFTSQTAFRIIGQTVGEIGSGSPTTLTAPINPMTGYPYFTIPAAAWGGGWSAANAVRFNTAAAKYPIWIGNAIQQHQGSSKDNYDFTIGYHANIDRERGDS
ncbi:hypothetical protein BTW00_05315 [Psychrobacter sp. C 20.9]|uniref:hypothetical protein n=1 Tax=Psychrobacter sp. C 20.9 TaxID=1926477 RepID=UPI000946921E|nr:hypothetical protein [Psychrobacter sp. C 20.9]OLF36507.1 hypothetical protein BTW00_05315 [Psychrobacter sp. C 20.9]